VRLIRPPCYARPMAPRRRLTVSGSAHLGEVDKFLSDAQNSLSNVLTTEMSGRDSAAYELGNDLYRQIEKMRRRILDLTVYGSSRS